MTPTTSARGHAEGGSQVGRVALVGAGPGDPDLLTLKAARLIGEADILFVDRLVGRRILPMVNDEAEVVFVGKSKGEHSVPQEQIHALMIEAAQAGKFAVRLKGGDPFVFGRGGEEVQALRDAGIDVEVVPGVSSALGCAAAAQIPLTHRGLAQSVTFVTGHAALGAEPDLDWKALGRANQTVVVFMGVGAAGGISRRLVEAGRGGETPVAVIENGTRRNEIRAYGRLDELEALISREGIEGPALLVIGEVAALGADAPLRLADFVSEPPPPIEDGWRTSAPTSSSTHLVGRGVERSETEGGSATPTVSDLWGASAMSSARPKLKPDTPKAITAWITTTGRTVYLTPDREWSEDVMDAAVLVGPKDEEELAFALADEQRVTDPYFMQAKLEGGVDGRETLRETIRAQGPTNHPMFGRQAGNP